MRRLCTRLPAGSITFPPRGDPPGALVFMDFSILDQPRAQRRDHLRGGRMGTRSITVTVDGVRYTDDVEPRTLLVHYLREQLGKVGTVVGCDTSNCGACTVHLDGESVKCCTVLAVQADGGEVTTIEGLADDGELHPMQKAFHEMHGLQCGFCTPGMIMAVDRPGRTTTRTRPRTRSARASRATSAAAPATRTSSAAVQAARPTRDGAAGRGRRDRGRCRHDRSSTTDPGRPPSARSARPRRRKEDARLITGRTTLDRQHRAARHAAPRDAAQPDRARQDHRRSTPRAAQEAPGRRRRLHRPDFAESRAGCRAPGRSPPDMSHPGAPAARASTRSTTSARPSRSSPPAARPPGAATRSS